MQMKTLFGAAAHLRSPQPLRVHADSHTTTVTIATVNNGDMIRMQGLTDDFHVHESRHRSRMGDAGRKCAAPARDPGHRRQGRPSSTS